MMAPDPERWAPGRQNRQAVRQTGSADRSDSDLPASDHVLLGAGTLGHLPVQADNPYWTENDAVTVEDLDHWPVVRMPRPLA